MRSWHALMAVAALVGVSEGLRAVDAQVVDIGSRLELFADNTLIEKMDRAQLQLHHPTPREVAIVHDQPWEGSGCCYMTVFQDGPLYRMYYRGAHGVYKPGRYESVHPDLTCYAESKDGIHWVKPDLGLFEFKGSKKNNLIMTPDVAQLATHNFCPFLDTRPGVPPAERYKAVGGVTGGLYAFVSADGIRWRKMADDFIITKGAFDSQNLVFWDALAGEYRAYFRDFRNGRDIKLATSKDFLRWTEPVWLEYTAGRVSELYTNQILPYYRAPHIYLGFPTRYIDRGWTDSTAALPQLEYRKVRASQEQREGTALTDGMFMVSRDGKRFFVWPESFIRPGLRLKENWFYGDNYQAWGLVQTKSDISGAPDEISIYVNECAAQVEVSRHRRFTIRLDGFVSVNAPMSGGEMVTRPIRFAGKQLVVNFSTSAAGSIRVEIQGPDGKPVEGFALADCPEIYGDTLERVVTWKGGGDVSRLAGKPVRLRFVLKDADLYSIRFR